MTNIAEANALAEQYLATSISAMSDTLRHMTACTLAQHVRALAIEVERLKKIVDAPDPHNFSLAQELEMKHQRIRWEANGEDQRKQDIDWFWLVVYLAAGAMRTLTHDLEATLSVTSDDAITRAFENKDGGDHEKLLHRIIATGAACGNWHAQRMGLTTMRPH
jgi:hypothetical protein